MLSVTEASQLSALIRGGALPANLTKASSSSTLSVARSGYLDLDRGKFIKPARSVNRQKARRIQ